MFQVGDVGVAAVGRYAQLFKLTVRGLPRLTDCGE